MFLLLRLLPGTLALSILAGSTHTRETRAALRAELGLDRPLLEQYGRWLLSMLRGEFGGRSLASHEAIGPLLARRAPVTLLLALYAMLGSLAAAVPLGVIAALHRGRWLDRLIRLATVGGSSLPMVLLSLASLVALLRLFRWSPPVVYRAPWEAPGEHALIMVFPALLLAWEASGGLVSVVRASFLDALGSSYLLAARARGVPRSALLWRHALRPVLVPFTAAAGLQWGALVGGIIVVESVFGLPGLGGALVQAALARDYPVVQTIVTLLVLLPWEWARHWTSSTGSLIRGRAMPWTPENAPTARLRALLASGGGAPPHRGGGSRPPDSDLAGSARAGRLGQASAPGERTPAGD